VAGVICVVVFGLATAGRSLEELTEPTKETSE
jgi:putative MFS transporter